jgi:hypothetical protein
MAKLQSSISFEVRKVGFAVKLRKQFCLSGGTVFRMLVLLPYLTVHFKKKKCMALQNWGILFRGLNQSLCRRF